jgi:hypothetical protein
MFRGLLGLGFAIATIPLATVQEPASSTRISLDQHYSVQRGSREYKAIERFIASNISGKHGAFGTEESVTRQSLGNVIDVRLNYSAAAATDMTAMDVVPVPASNPPWLPHDRHPSDGDTTTLGTCSRSTGLSQAWTFTYVVNPDGSSEWVITEYRGTHVKRCSSGR